MHLGVPRAGSRSQSSPKLPLPKWVSPGTPCKAHPSHACSSADLRLDLRWDVRKARLREEIDYLLKTARSYSSWLRIQHDLCLVSSGASNNVT